MIQKQRSLHNRDVEIQHLLKCRCIIFRTLKLVPEATTFLEKHIFWYFGVYWQNFFNSLQKASLCVHDRAKALRLLLQNELLAVFFLLLLLLLVKALNSSSFSDTWRKRASPCFFIRIGRSFLVRLSSMSNNFWQTISSIFRLAVPRKSVCKITSRVSPRPESLDWIGKIKFDFMLKLNLLNEILFFSRVAQYRVCFDKVSNISTIFLNSPFGCLFLIKKIVEIHLRNKQASQGVFVQGIIVRKDWGPWRSIEWQSAQLLVRGIDLPSPDA